MKTIFFNSLNNKKATMETWVSSEWPLLNSDFDEGSIMADFDCEDFTYLTNPACSPNSSEFSNNPDEIMNGLS